MKNTKFSRISALILALSLCLGMLVSFNVCAEDTQQTETKPEIFSQNVKYNEKFCLMYAVDAATATAPVTLYLYQANPEDGAVPSKQYVVDEVTAAYGNLEKDSYIFTTDGIAAYAMAQDVYVQAVDANGNKSDVKKYSVGQYLYERLASSDVTVEQRNFYNSALDFGAYAQKVIAKETDETKYINNYCYVTSIDGTTVNGFGSGIYPKGSTVTLAKDGADKLTAIAYDADGGYIPKITADSYTIPTDAVSVEVSSGARIIYRDQMETFEGYNVGDRKYFTAEGTVAAGIVDAGSDHNNVYSMEFKSGSTVYSWNSLSQDIASAEKATAVERSFDIRVTLDKTVNTASDPFFSLTMAFGGSHTRAFRTQVHFKNDKLELMSYKTTVGRTAYSDIELGEWFHVRAVCYEGDPNIYYYINGSDTPFVDSNKENASYTDDISTLCYPRFSALNANGAGFTIEIDNYFFGYTMDKSPNAQ